MKITLNEDDMGCEHGPEFRVTCGTCERNWCDKCNPTPSARCLYEYDHAPLAPHGGCNWKGCRECFPHDIENHPETKTFDELVEEFWLYAEPAYAKFDELTKARITVALDVFRKDTKK